MAASTDPHTAAGSPAAVVLLSGGLDSATALAVALNEGYRAFALSIDYGQRHKIEIEAALRLARCLGASGHTVAAVDLARFGGSALTTDALRVPHGASACSREAGIPVTYVPARNTVFLSLALAFAETLGAGDIFIGVNAIDYSGYPDCRPEYISAFEAMANLATKAAVERRQQVRVHAPLIKMTKAQIIQTGLRLGVDYSQTHSCYDPASSGRACGSCASCLLRQKGFGELGLADPALA